MLPIHTKSTEIRAFFPSSDTLESISNPPFPTPEHAMPRQKLDSTDISEKLATVSDWSIDAGETALSRSFKFANFSEAFGFMTRAALAAEKLDHHPEWKNVYRTVDIRLTTHDAGGLTGLDFDLAAEMDAIAAAMGHQH
jgi:4a-hydroxytetrahydrobiopterin dehydratase